MRIRKSSCSKDPIKNTIYRPTWLVSIKSLGDLLKEAYLRAAPKRLVKQLLEAEKAMTGHYE
jgi:hypothetical protein